MKNNNPKFVRLHEAIESSCLLLASPRRSRLDAVKQYVGSHYSDNGSLKKVPTNFLELAVTIYSRMLAARTPRALVTTEAIELRPFARDLEIALNQIPKEIKFGETLKRAVLDAFFGFSVVKVGIAPQGKEVSGVPYSEPYVDYVELDDYFCDMTAKDWGSIQFEGNDYWADKEDVKALFGVDLDADEFNAVGPSGEEQAKSVGASTPGTPYMDRVQLRDVYICNTGRVITYALKSMVIIRDEFFDGPDGSPYVHLGYSKVPGNLLPLPPVMLWLDMHELGNVLFRKLANQADKKKSVAAFGGGNEDDVRALQGANDGDGIRYSGQKPEVINVGGIDAPTLAFYLQVRDLFSYFSGNLDSLGGLSPQSDTLGQDKLLNEAANARVSAMSEAVVDFAKEIFERLAWYVWTDPVRERTIRKTVRGYEQISITKKWTPETRDGDFLDYNFSVDVYSMQDNSPSTKVQKFGQVFERFILPLMPMLQEQGAYIDIEAVCSFLAKHADLPELDEFVKFSNATQQERPPKGNPNPDQDQSYKPPVTTRRYERVNRPGGSRSGNDNAMSRLLMGENLQPAEASAAGRGVS